MEERGAVRVCVRVEGAVWAQLRFIQRTWQKTQRRFSHVQRSAVHWKRERGELSVSSGARAEARNPEIYALVSFTGGQQQLVFFFNSFIIMISVLVQEQEYEYEIEFHLF